MLIAKQKKQENIAEYILYIWQLEDLLRAYEFDIGQIKLNLVEQFEVSSVEKEHIAKWYEEMMEIMRQEDILENGHLVFIQNIVNDLNELHLYLMKLPEHSDYQNIYAKAKAFIEALATKNKKITNEIELCFVALYGLMMMRMRKIEVSKETEEAVSVFSHLIALLSKKYHQIEKGEIQLNY